MNERKSLVDGASDKTTYVLNINDTKHLPQKKPLECFEVKVVPQDLVQHTGDARDDVAKGDATMTSAASSSTAAAPVAGSSKEGEHKDDNIEKDVEEYEIERIVSRRRKSGACEVLVKWKNYSSHDNTWESEKLVRSYAGFEKAYAEFRDVQIKQGRAALSRSPAPKRKLVLEEEVTVSFAYKMTNSAVKTFGSELKKSMMNVAAEANRIRQKQNNSFIEDLHVLEAFQKTTGKTIYH